MTKQTSIIVVSALLIGALAWIDALFIPLVTIGPVLSGLAAGACQIRPRTVAIPWFFGGILMLVSDLVINQEDVAFHAVIAVFTAMLAAGAARLARRMRSSRPRPGAGRNAARSAS